MVNKFNDFQKKIELNSIQWNGPKHTAFAAFLVLNLYKNDNSNQWKPYFDMLPDKMFSNPLLYEDKDLESLRGTDNLAKVDEQKKLMKMIMINLLNICQNIQFSL